MKSEAFDLAIYEELRKIREALQDIAHSLGGFKQPVSVNLYQPEPLKQTETR